MAPDLAVNPAARVSELDPTLPTLFIAGDSTAARGSGENQMGWALPLADFFDAAAVNVVNRARGGRSSRTFVTEGLWEELIADVKPGDLVLIQFGHNDGGPVNDEHRARGSLPGLGEETEAINNLVTGRHEVVHTFGWYLRRMVADVRERGATPILLSLTVRNIWKDGRVERGSGQFGPWSYQVAKEAGIPFIDVTDFVADSFDAAGEVVVSAMYPQDHTHFNAEGAGRHAAAVVALLKGLRPDRVADLLSEKGEAVEADPLSWLNLPMPADNRLPTLFLIGDSTVRNGRGDGEDGQWGWGDYVGAFFDEDSINVVNRAVGGLSSRTYLTQGHWDRVLGMLKTGDFVVMQFGHNDSGPLNDDHRARGTIKGVGEETEEIDNLITGQHEVVHTYGWYLRQFVADTRRMGATPIICSPVPRKSWKDGRIIRGRDSHAGWAGEVADFAGVGFVDLNEIIAMRYDDLGPEKVDELFADAHTHTSEAGAVVNAEAVVTGLKSLPDNPLVDFFLIEGP